MMRWTGYVPTFLTFHVSGMKLSLSDVLGAEMSLLHPKGADVDVYRYLGKCFQDSRMLQHPALSATGTRYRLVPVRCESGIACCASRVLEK